MNNKMIYKARLVCLGYMETLPDVDSPTVDKSNMRLFAALCGIFGLRPKSMDIKSAFLQSSELDREVYVRPPKDLKKANVIWLLRKPLYGLVDSSKNWYKTFSKFLVDLGLTISKFDKALFFLYSNRLEGVCIIHVDDVMYAGSVKFMKLMSKVKKRFIISREDQGNLRYLGINLVCDAEGVKLSQRDYVINPIVLQNIRGRTQLSDREVTQFQSILGKLNWLTGPEI